MATTTIAGRRAWTLAPLLALAVLSPARAHAAACCMSATSFGVGRLLIWEESAFGVRAGHSRILGEWTPGSALRPYGADYAEGVTVAEPWAIVRLHERIQVQAWIPVLMNDRESAADRQLAGWLGDVGGAVRLEPVAIGQFEGLPSLAFTLAVVAPTGRRIEQTLPPLFAGATGKGAWTGSLAVETEYAHLPWFVRGDAGVTLALPYVHAQTELSQQPGPLVQASFSAGREVIRDRLVAALALQGEWQAALRVDGDVVDGSEAHLLSLAASLSWRFDPHWTLVGALSNSVWPAVAGRNRDARLGLNVGIRHGYF